MPRHAPFALLRPLPLLMALACTPLAQAAEPLRLSYTDLGAPPGGQSTALAINDAGQIAGTATNARTTPALPGVDHAATWRDGTLVLLGVGMARAINAQGHVAGSSIDTATGTETATVWLDNSTRRLLGPGQAWGINDQGEVVGRSGTASALLPAVWRDGIAKVLGQQAGVATGIDNDGLIVGYEPVPGSAGCGNRARVWVNDTLVTPPYDEFGQIHGVDGAGKGVGMACDGTPRSNRNAATWNTAGVSTRLQDSATSSGTAFGANKAGLIVGVNNNQATLWDTRGGTAVATQLASLLVQPLPAGWYLSAAHDINERNEIVGQACNVNLNVCHGFLLKPTTAPTCSATYRVSGLSNFWLTGQVTLRNDGVNGASGWEVQLGMSGNMFLVGRQGANIKVTSGRELAATPKASNTTVPAGGATTFTFTAFRNKQMQEPVSMTATLGGQACSVKWE